VIETASSARFVVAWQSICEVAPICEIAQFLSVVTDLIF
jgi:hypothetical protein